MTAKEFELIERELTHEIIGAFFTVYNELGYGFLESVYANALAIELETRALTIARETPLEILYLGQKVGFFRADLLVNNTVLVELKSSEKLCVADRRQTLNYLKATGLRVGLLFHFGPKPSFERLVK
jgi:GxxExxY protein